MFTHYLKLAWRNLSRNKAFSAINIGGLTVGLASCIMIGLYAYHELSYDRFHSAHKNIYRVNKIANEKGGQASYNGISPGQLAPALAKDFPEVIAATRFRPWFNEMLVSHDTTKLKLDDVIYADASFLKIFDFPLVKGDRNKVLSEPYAAVITESTAAKYFKDKNPIGETLVTLNDIPVKVSGVAKDPPVNSSIQFTMLISWATISSPAAKDYFSWMDNWTTQVNFTFVQLKENSNPSLVAAKISTLLHKYRPDDEFQYRSYLQPLDDIHLKSSGIQFADQFHTNNRKIVITLLIIAGFILVIACFNFINLATAGAMGRAKETGIQKVLGARQLQLIGKFFNESFLLCTISLILAVILTAILLPSFNKLANTGLDTALLFKGNVIAAFLGLLLLISIVAGLYPAIILSSYKSTDVFRNVIKGGRNNWLRKSLVTTQFTLSILLIVATIVVNKQISFISSKDLGFDRDQVVVLQLTNTGLEAKSRDLVHALQRNPNILSVSSSNRVPGQGFNGYGVIPEGHTLDEHLMANVLETDADFMSTYNLKLLQGRYFSPQMPTDTTDAIVINEAMAKYIGWTNPVGKQFEIYEARKGKVIGVVKDFNFASLRENVQPLAVMLANNPLYLSVKLKAGSIQSSLEYMRNQWKQMGTDYPFDYFFLDEQLNKYYQSDVRLLRVLSIFASIAIIIACMGLFGLSIYTARQRIKEIGIRKVVGASVGNIVTLLSKDFLKLVLLAIVIATPIAWYAMHKWLQDFAYRVDIAWWVFAFAGILAAVIALATISFHAVKAAIANPVKSLRTE